LAGNNFTCRSIKLVSDWLRNNNHSTNIVAMVYQITL
jgi:hypothetical protein